MPDVVFEVAHWFTVIILLTFVGTQYWRKKVLEVANLHRDFTFAIADEEEYQNRLKDFGLDDSGEDVNIALLDEKERRYRMEEEFSEDTLQEFLEAYKNGKLLEDSLGIEGSVNC